MKNILNAAIVGTMFVAPIAFGQILNLTPSGDEVVFDNSIIKVVEFGEDNTIGVWLLEGEVLTLRDQFGEVISTCDRTLPGDEVFGEFGANAVNIDGSRVQYVGIDGQSLAGWSIDCLTNEVQVVGGYIPTYTDPEGEYVVGYNGSGTNLYRPNGDIEFLAFLDERIFYYSGNADGSLLGGYQSTPDGDIRGYINTQGQLGTTRGLAVVRETPLGDTVVLGQLFGETISMDVLTEDEWRTIRAGWVAADANPGGFAFNRATVGEGEFGEDILGFGCVLSLDVASLDEFQLVTEGPFIPGADTESADQIASERIDNWCQSFVEQDGIYYVATGDSWQNTFKLQILSEAGVEPVEFQGCVDTPPLGDGFGWNGIESCEVEGLAVASSGECFDSPPLGDGFGWDGVATCRIEATDDANVSVASSGDCFDSPPLNDGFGWDGVATCTIDASYTSEQVLVAGDCIESVPLGDGFGWDGQNSCVVNEDNATGTATLASSGSCVDTVPLNDGFGWDGFASCEVDGAVISATGTCIDTLPLGDGFGWDGVDTCTIETNAVIATTGECIDVAPFDDNYGFNGTNGCYIADVDPDAVFNGCIDSPPVGDGYGWDGSATCLIE